MSHLRRTLTLLLVCAHGSAAALPCTPSLQASAEVAIHRGAEPIAHGHPGPGAHPTDRGQQAHDVHDAHDVHHAGHDVHHAGHDAHAPEVTLAAPCPCGCEAAPPDAGNTSRVGAALPCEAAALAAPPERAATDPSRAPAPAGSDTTRDRVPI